jgi:hypothetical protein
MHLRPKLEVQQVKCHLIGIFPMLRTSIDPMSELVPNRALPKYLRSNEIALRALWQFEELQMKFRFVKWMFKYASLLLFVSSLGQML